jgi:SIR2-like domain
MNLKETMRDRDWERLLEAIRSGKCTPFIGPGVLAGHLPLAGEIAQYWAQKYNYPMEDSRDLSRVAQFIAVTNDASRPAELLARQFEEVAPPDFQNPENPYAILADLPFSLYITTNYDDFMIRALHAKHKDPHQEICLWNRYLQREASLLRSDFEPSSANPMVFHLQGAVGMPESLVLKEDDYLDFLVTVAREDNLFPRVVQKACASTLLLFLGCRLYDWNFQVIYKGLAGIVERSLRRGHLAVMLPPSSQSSRAEQELLDRYSERSDIRIYWGTVQEFTTELRERMRGESR